MEENLVGYLLGALEPGDHAQVEEYLRLHPAEQEKLDLLRQALRPLGLDGVDIEPPPGLAQRTVAAAYGQRYNDLPRAPKQSGRLLAFPSFVRRADVLVAACLLILVGGIAISWISQARYHSGVLDCQNDLKTIYAGLQTYNDKHGKIPNVHTIAKPPRDVAGLVIPKLISAGCLDSNFCVHCPSGKKSAPPLSYEQALNLADHEFSNNVDSLTPCYGFALGYKDQQGALHGPQFNAPGDWNMIVLAADRPPNDPTSGNSPNHAGKGQNVLFLSGKVQFVPDRDKSFNGDDLYLNKDHKVSAGVDPEDNVIGGSKARP